MIRSSACPPWPPDQPGQRRRSTVPAVSYTTTGDTTRSNTTQETLQCAVAERREQARLLFEKGYEKMRSDAPEDAERLFLEGLRLDSENADAIFYWGHARILTGNPFAKGSYEAFREALKMEVA